MKVDPTIRNRRDKQRGIQKVAECEEGKKRREGKTQVGGQYKTDGA